jgi:Cutinase
MARWNRRARLTWSASVLTSLTALSLAFAGPADAVPSTATCPQVEITTIRGQGEPAGNGWVLGPIATSLQSKLTQTVKIYPLPYAAGLDLTQNFNQGIKLLTSHLDSMARTCPKTRTVVLGFSMGAIVAGETFAPTTRYPGIATTALPNRIDAPLAAVIIFGDARFNSAGPEAAGSFWPGVDAPYARPATAFSRFPNKVRNVCNATDGICQNLPSTLTTERAHQDYVKYTDAVISYVRAQLA